jgi:hypothetical protein
VIPGRLTAVAGVAVAVLAGAEAANAIITTNTIDELATHKRDGRLVRTTGPIGCARARRGTRFEDGRGRVCAVARARRGSRVTDTRRWCEQVRVAEVLKEER